MRVIPALDPLEHHKLCFRLRFESPSVENFPLKRCEKAFRHRIVIVVRITHRAQRWHDVLLPTPFAERVARVLAAVIAVMYDRVRTTLRVRRIQCR
jgi:hypothetical protein